MPRLFLDCDGVLADFDTYASQLFGMPPRQFAARYGAKRFWSRIARHEDFFYKLPLMPDARELWDAVAHLHPIILTGLPRGDWAAPQKMRWAAGHFPEARMITTMARAKRDHMESPGDVLVDDLLKYKTVWEEVGGVFVHHRNAKTTLKELKALGFDVRG